MSLAIPSPQSEDLPQRKLSFWQMTGPGAVLVGLSIGAGELVIWPWITAKFGASMAWAALAGVFLQLWINFEIGRWAIATGESLYTGFARVWSFVIRIFITLIMLVAFLPGWARASGAALKALAFGPDGPGPDWFWTGLTFAGIAVLLFGPKVMYKAVEKTMTVLLVLIVAGLLFVIFKVASWDTTLELLRGMVNFGHIELDQEFTFPRFFSAVVFAGAGGVSNLFYAYYLRDKGIGMGARIPELSNPIRHQETEDVAVGFIVRETEENRKRFRDWFRWVILDQTLYFWLLNSFTMLLFMFGALAVLHPQGLVPAEGQLVWDEAVILSDSVGPAGRYIFLFIGMATLFSTQLANIDGNARTMADLLHTHFRFGRRLSQGRWYVWVASAIMVFGVLSTWILDRFHITALGFIFNSALIGGFAMAIYTPLTLYINLRHLPPMARPRLPNIIMVGVGALVYVSFAVYTVVGLFL